MGAILASPDPDARAYSPPTPRAAQRESLLFDDGCAIQTPAAGRRSASGDTMRKPPQISRRTAGYSLSLSRNFGTPSAAPVDENGGGCGNHGSGASATAASGTGQQAARAARLGVSLMNVVRHSTELQKFMDTADAARAPLARFETLTGQLQRAEDALSTVRAALEGNAQRENVAASLLRQADKDHALDEAQRLQCRTPQLTMLVRNLLSSVQATASLCLKLMRGASGGASGLLGGGSAGGGGSHGGGGSLDAVSESAVRRAAQALEQAVGGFEGCVPVAPASAATGAGSQLDGGEAGAASATAASASSSTAAIAPRRHAEKSVAHDGSSDAPPPPHMQPRPPSTPNLATAGDGPGAPPRAGRRARAPLSTLSAHVNQADPFTDLGAPSPAPPSSHEEWPSALGARPPPLRRPAKVLSRMSADPHPTEDVTRTLSFPTAATPAAAASGGASAYAAPAPPPAAAVATTPRAIHAAALVDISTDPNHHRHSHQHQHQHQHRRHRSIGDGGDDSDEGCGGVGGFPRPPAAADEWNEHQCRPRRLNFASRPSSAAPLQPLSGALPATPPPADVLCGRRSLHAAIAAGQASAAAGSCSSSSSASSFSFSSAPLPPPPLVDPAKAPPTAAYSFSSLSPMPPSPRSSAAALLSAAGREAAAPSLACMPPSAPSPVARLIASTRPGSAALLGSRFNRLGSAGGAR